MEKRQQSDKFTLYRNRNFIASWKRKILVSFSSMQQTTTHAVTINFKWWTSICDHHQVELLQNPILLRKFPDFIFFNNSFWIICFNFCTLNNNNSTKKHHHIYSREWENYYWLWQKNKNKSYFRHSNDRKKPKP
jgi:hypothetical protein